MIHVSDLKINKYFVVFVVVVVVLFFVVGRSLKLPDCVATESGVWEGEEGGAVGVRGAGEVEQRTDAFCCCLSSRERWTWGRSVSKNQDCSLLRDLQRGTADAEIKVPLARIQSCHHLKKIYVLPSKCGVCQNIAMRALPTARNGLLVLSTF